jgi:hypothetical protein
MPPTGRTIKLPLLRHRDLMVSRESGDHEHHARCGAELRLCDAAVGETGGAVKSQRVRIGGHLQALHVPCSQDVRDAVDQRGGDPASHIARVHEEVFQFDGAVGLGPGGEADKRAVLFGDVSAAFG